jgi:hypothetical protein
MNLKNEAKLEQFKLQDMVKGWFIGAFEPTLYSTNDVEVGVKSYKKGDYEAAHYHKVATEFTVIIEGEVEMNGVRYVKDDIIKIQPGVSTDFRVITDTITIVVKIPGASSDKYISSI